MTGSTVSSVPTFMCLLLLCLLGYALSLLLQLLSVLCLNTVPNDAESTVTVSVNSVTVVYMQGAEYNFHLL